MVVNCGCINMAELNKKLHIRKGSTEQTAKLYTTEAEAGYAFSYIKIDGVQTYLPLGEPNDGRATIGRVKETSGHEFAILTSGKPLYHKDSYTTPGTHTWTCPAGVTTAIVTVAGGGGGGLATRWKLNIAGAKYRGVPGGNGANATYTISVIPLKTYTVVVGAGGYPYISTNSGDKTSSRYAGNGGVSSFDSLTAGGGQGGYFITGEYAFYSGASYGSGGAGGSTWDTGANAGGNGWVYVEYGGDI